MKHFNIMKQVDLIHYQPKLFFSRMGFQLEKHFYFYNINFYVLRITIWLGTLLIDCHRVFSTKIYKFIVIFHLLYSLDF